MKGEKMKRRTVMSILLSFALAIGLLAGCGGGESADGTGTETEAADDDTAAETTAADTETEAGSEAAATENGGYPTTGEEYEIYYIAISETGGQIQNLLDIVEMYKEQVNPNFTMTIEYITDQQARNQKIRTLAASNELPDWFTCDIDSFFNELWDAGMVANIGDIYDQLGIRDNFYPISLNYPSTDEGEVCGISWQSQSEFFYYNKDVFEAAHIDSVPKTMDELFEVCQKIQETGKVPIAMDGAWRLLRFLAFVPYRMTGNEFIETAAAGSQPFSSEVGLAGAQFIEDIGQYFQKGWTTADSTTVAQLVVNGDAGMYYSGSWDLNIFGKENMELLDNIGIFTLPALGEDDATAPTDGFYNGGTPTVISAECAAEEEFMNFFRFLWDHYNDGAFEHGYLPPGKPSSMEGASELQKELLNNYANAGSFAKCWDVVADVATSEVLLNETPSLTLGDLTPEEWAARLDEAIKQNVQQ